MIGVLTDAVDLETAAEFFELFKTPWEPAVPGRKYRVALSTRESADADVTLLYGAEERALDRQIGVTVRRANPPIEIDFEEAPFPIYARAVLFEGDCAGGFLTAGGQPVAYRNDSPGRTVWRIGYDLFRETRHLLSRGQPRYHAHVPTLDLHIALMRRMLFESGVSFIEVPARPHGYDFTCCLTHDLDFFGIRRHGLDATLAGFMARAAAGTFVEWLRGRRPFSDAIRNWQALVSLPFVFLGSAEDFWHPIADYARAEQGRRSTYFVVPFKGRPGGASPDGILNPRRAVKYQASDVRDELREAASCGNELAVHGIDAWRDTEAGCREKHELLELAGRPDVGVRMHWLYFADDSPAKLERAGFAYDSTWGYNDAVGYRAGTSQVFRLSGTSRLMELPLSIMDTALLFRDRMNLDRNEALQRCFRIVTDRRRFGGTLVINWHDRSLAPERLWGDTYAALLEEVGSRHQVWFATASEAVNWYKWRRSIAFTCESDGRITVTASTRDQTLPGARVTVHRHGDGHARGVEELPLTGSERLTIIL